MTTAQELGALVGCVEETFARLAANLVTDCGGVVTSHTSSHTGRVMSVYQPFIVVTLPQSATLPRADYGVSYCMDRGPRPYFAEVYYPGLFWNGYRPYVYAHRSTPEALAKWVAWNLGPPLLLEWAARRWQRGFRLRRTPEWRGAVVVQRAFRRANSDPGFLLCRRRLAREFEGFGGAAR
jgi:hypothetical protein